MFVLVYDGRSAFSLIEAHCLLPNDLHNLHMGNLVYIYGDASELERALELLAKSGLAEHGRVIEGRSGDPVNGRGEPQPELPARSTVVGASGGVINPAAAAFTPGRTEVRTGMHGDRVLPEDLNFGSAEEAEHYADVLNGNGSLLVIEGGSDVLDRVERVLDNHSGQGVARH